MCWVGVEGPVDRCFERTRFLGRIGGNKSVSVLRRHCDKEDGKTVCSISIQFNWKKKGFRKSVFRANYILLYNWPEKYKNLIKNKWLVKNMIVIEILSLVDKLTSIFINLQKIYDNKKIWKLSSTKKASLVDVLEKIEKREFCELIWKRKEPTW